MLSPERKQRIEELLLEKEAGRLDTPIRVLKAIPKGWDAMKAAYRAAPKPRSSTIPGTTPKLSPDVQQAWMGIANRPPVKTKISPSAAMVAEFGLPQARPGFPGDTARKLRRMQKTDAREAREARHLMKTPKSTALVPAKPTALGKTKQQIKNEATIDKAYMEPSPPPMSRVGPSPFSKFFGAKKIPSIDKFTGKPKPAPVRKAGTVIDASANSRAQKAWGMLANPKP